MIRLWVGSLPGPGRVNLGRGAQATKVISFLKKLLTTWTDLGRGGCLDLEGEIWRAQATKLTSFLQSMLTTWTDFGRGGCLYLDGAIWGVDPRQQKWIVSLRNWYQHYQNLGRVDSWIWKGRSEERSPGNKSEQFPYEIVNNVNRFWELAGKLGSTFCYFVLEYF